MDSGKRAIVLRLLPELTVNPKTIVAGEATGKSTCHALLACD